MAAKTFTANATNDRLTSTAHGLANMDTVRLFPVDSGTLPAPLEENVPYTVRVIDANTFQVYLMRHQAANGLQPIDLSTNGSGTLVFVKELP